MSSSQVDEILNIYKKLAQKPTLTSSRIVNNKRGSSIQSNWSQRNLEKNKKQKFTKEFFYDSDLNLIAESYPVDVTSEISTTLSNDAELKAILREVGNDGKTKQIIEIWNKQYLVKSYDLSAFDVHGDVYSDSTFSTFQWSSDNSRLLYIAEKKLPKPQPFYCQKSKSDAEKARDDEQCFRGTEYIFKPDWGEQLVGKHKSVVVILNVQEDTIEPVSSIPENYFPSQVTWVPNTLEIVGVFYKLCPRYLGKVFCTNRESFIFHLEGKDFQMITQKGIYCSSPRFSPNGQSLIWLERDISPPHHHVQRLMHLKWGEKKPSVLVDVVKTYVNIVGKKKFYGLYNQDLPLQCWSEDSRYIFLSSPQRFNVTSYIIDKETKTITEIANESESSLTILDVQYNLIAFKKSSIMQVSQLLVGKFDASAVLSGTLDLTNCTEPEYLPEGSTLTYECTEFEYKNVSDSVKDFNFIYFGKKKGPDKSTPLIAVIHGGPHSVYSNEFNLVYAVFALLGFGVLEINYRGSTGLGGDNVEYIIGKVGESDVLDCVTAIKTALVKYPWLDPKRVALHGGSHGGFISAHLSGQYPDMFKAVVMRNPVIELAANFSLTDIPDWCPGENGRWDLGVLPETTTTSNYPKLMQILLKHSPYMHVDKVKAPTLIALGSKDLRVPDPQGKLWYYRLCENNVATKLYIYDDNHSLLKDEVEIDFTINAALWIIHHTRN